uniref:ORF3 n=1 Tax=Rodent Torque teno virus 1 TaxID=1514664 RepID=X2G378_9VIRU|nr:ORF3 [Rodent Torque teno virus 1]
MFLFPRTPMMASGSHTPQGWWPVLGPQCNMSGQKMVNILKKPGKGLQDLLKKFHKPSHTFKPLRKPRRKLTMRGRKKRYTSAKHPDTSSTDSSEYSTDSSVFSSSEEESWEQGVSITPSQEMNWTQFINKLCSGQPV